MVAVHFPSDERGPEPARGLLYLSFRLFPQDRSAFLGDVGLPGPLESLSRILHSGAVRANRIERPSLQPFPDPSVQVTPVDHIPHIRILAGHIVGRSAEHRVQHGPVQPALQAKARDDQRNAPTVIRDLTGPEGALAGSPLLDPLAPALRAPRAQLPSPLQGPALAYGAHLSIPGGGPSGGPLRLPDRGHVLPSAVQLPDQVGHVLRALALEDHGLHLAARDVVRHLADQRLQLRLPVLVGDHKVDALTVLVHAAAHGVLLLDQGAKAPAQAVQHDHPPDNVGETGKGSDQRPPVPPQGEQAKGGAGLIAGRWVDQVAQGKGL